MFAFIKKERSERIGQAMQKHLITRLLTSHVALTFCYGIFLFLYELKFLRETVPVVHPILIGWAGLLAVYDILVRRLWEKLPLWQPLLIFGVLAGATALVNRQTGLVTNLKAWVLTMLPLVAFLPLCLLGDGEKREKALLKALSGGAVVAFLASLVAVVMYLLRISAQVELGGITHMVGYRYYILDDPDSGILLYGLYTDTNHAAAYAVVFALYSLWLLDACRRGVCGKTIRVFAITNLVVQACYFPLANSRGGWLCLAVAGVLCVFLYAFCTRLKTENKLKKAGLALVAAVACVAVLFGALMVVRSALSVVSNAMEGVIAFDGGGEVTVEPPVSWGEQGVDTFQKTDDGFGAGRLNIWLEGLRLYTQRPVLGVGPGNATHYAQLLGEGELVRYGKAMHNSYLDLLVDYGALGFLALMGFFAGCLWLVLRSFFLRGKMLTVSTHMSAFGVVFLAGVCLFLSCAFMNTTAMYYLMLCLLSYLMAQCKDVKG